MKSMAMAGVLTLALASAPAFAQTSAQQPKPPAGQKASGAPGQVDAAFVKQAAMGGMAEVELGRLAADKASNADVKQFAQRMVDDHSKANDELKGVASSKGIELAADLDAKHKAVRDKLAKLEGAAFDRAYMAQMVTDHQQTVQLFQREAKTGKDTDLQKWAADKLPALQEHLKMARDLSGKVRGGAAYKQ
jgi:putative membrane protein